jgi:hypothetical protein
MLWMEHLLQEISWKDKMHMLRRDKKEEEDGDNIYLIFAFFIVANMLSQLYFVQHSPVKKV